MHKGLTLYSPLLRMKTGELNGIVNLRNIIKDFIRPHFIIPPSAERENLNFDLFDQLEGQSNAGQLLAPFWRGRSAFLNPRYIYKEFGEEKATDWLPKLYESARSGSVDAIPVASLRDLESPRFDGLLNSIDRSRELQFMVSLKADDLLDTNLKSRLDKQLSRLKISSGNCSIQVDFQGSYFEEPDGVAEIIEGAYEDIQAFGTWESIVFQGTSFPEVNPAQHGSVEIVPRNEWIAWSKAISLSSATPENFVFGDYAADSAKMHFGAGSAAAIRHYRYTTPESWLVSRGAETGKDKARMQWVATQILNSGQFAGRDFSQADEYIHNTANGSGGPGNSTTWRQINTTDHLTRVVHDIALARGIIIDVPADQKEHAKQLEFLQDL
ncbi:MAG: beta family protein [Hyphomonadaceae bacterium]